MDISLRPSTCPCCGEEVLHNNTLRRQAPARFGRHVRLNNYIDTQTHMWREEFGEGVSGALYVNGRYVGYDTLEGCGRIKLKCVTIYIFSSTACTGLDFV